jgi:hypothetical protein
MWSTHGPGEEEIILGWMAVDEKSTEIPGDTQVIGTPGREHLSSPEIG